VLEIILPAGGIDRESPVPFYFQLSELLQNEIAIGRWMPGDRLPSEAELGSRVGLSRTTVRQALMRLEQKGLISRRKGHGTFVEGTRPRSWMIQSSEGFFQDEWTRTGSTVTSKLVQAKAGPLPPWACDALGLPLQSHGATLERIRAIDGLVAMYNINHLPPSLADAALAHENPNESLYLRLKERAGVEVAGARRTLESVPAEEKLATMLEVPRGAPLLFVESVSWDINMQPFDCYQGWVRTDRLRIEIEVASSR
jgi:GntR family transcriptional regulator